MMLKILSIVLALSLCVASSTQAADQPIQPYQNKPMQDADKPDQSKGQPANHEQHMSPPSEGMEQPASQPKGRRPNKKPDKQPGGDKIPPELQSDNN